MKTDEEYKTSFSEEYHRSTEPRAPSEEQWNAWEYGGIEKKEETQRRERRPGQTLLLKLATVMAAATVAVDSISGATVSSNAAKSIIANIIDENGGDSSQWYTPVEKSTKTVTLDGYDAIIVGLGSSGVATYLSAALNGATVFGMETAAKIGGNGTNTAGPLGVNPQAQVEANGGEKFVD